MSEDPARVGYNWFIYARDNPVVQTDRSRKGSLEDLINFLKQVFGNLPGIGNPLSVLFGAESINNIRGALLQFVGIAAVQTSTMEQVENTWQTFMGVICGVPIAVAFIIGSLRALRGEERGRRLMIGCCVAALLFTRVSHTYDVLAPLRTPSFYSTSEWASHGQSSMIEDVLDSVSILLLLTVMVRSRSGILDRSGHGRRQSQELIHPGQA